MSFEIGDLVLVTQKGRDPYEDRVVDVDSNGNCWLKDGRIFGHEPRTTTSGRGLSKLTFPDEPDKA